jgi:uncharacterized protein YcaQ
VEHISNRPMRRWLLGRLGLAATPRGAFDKAQLLSLIEQLAYLQIDSINIVERAHHMILFSRHDGYQREMLFELVEEDRALFEHWTHDACILPITHLPHWQHRFDATRKKLNGPGWKKRLGPKPEQVLKAVRDRIKSEGPLRTRDFDNKNGVKRGPWWDWAHEKTALEFLWRTGELAITRRERFEKVYDLMENVAPAKHRRKKVSFAKSVDWKCREALVRLGAATPVEIAGFWNSHSTNTVKAWVEEQRAIGALIDVTIETADDSTPRARVSLPEFIESAAAAEAPSRGMRLLSPFDPLIRDRKRMSWLFGFDYRIEVFVPEAKREYGYYVLPILEGERLTGRIDLKAHRKQGVLEVKGLWWEEGVAASAQRMKALDGCLRRLAAFAGVQEVQGLR